VTSILSVEVAEPSSGVVVVRCRGEVDVSVCDHLDSALEAATARAAETLRVDMTAVGFMDSSGLRCLVDAQKRCREAGVGFELVASQAVRRLTDVVGLSGHLGVSDPT
jgi:anti-sigma B factor antagonist